jgi:hypothetical protein
MDATPTFSSSKIPSANDAEALARWQRGDDPRDVVLPLSVAAAWAYSGQDVFDEVMRRRGLHGGASKFAQVVNDAMFVCARAYVQPLGSGAIVAFRGTEPTDTINWLADATTQKVAFHATQPGAPRGYVHGGFYRNIRAIWPTVVEALDALQPEWIYFTGHSFGGALAALAGALLADYATEKPAGYGALWSKLKAVFTFGQPMVGDETFRSTYATSVGPRLVRYVFAHDIVPHLPPKTPGWTPTHLGTQYRAEDGGKWTADSQTSQPAGAILDNLIAVSAWIKDQIAFAPKLIPPYSWGDHAPSNYVRVSLPDGSDSGSEFD